MTPRNRSLIAFSVALLLVAGSCSASGDGESTTQSPANTAEPAEPAAPETQSITDEEILGLDWSSCGSAECAELVVPMNHNNPDGAVLTLALIRRRAPDADSAGVLVMNPGGPGASGIAMLRDGDAVPSVIAEQFDQISWDVRGTAQLGCQSRLVTFYALDLGPDTNQEAVAVDTSAAETANRCASTAGALLANVSTEQTVGDIEAIRVALGVEQINYIGFSYGTFLGLRYLDRFPDRLRTLVLDSVVDPTLSLEQFLTDQAVAFETVLDQLLADCGGQQPCSVASPADTLAEVERRTEAGDFASLGPTELNRALSIAGYIPSIHARLVDDLGDAVDGDVRGLMQLAAAFSSFANWDVYTAVTCVDSVAPVDWDTFLDNIAVAAPRFGLHFANELRPCETWQAPNEAISTPVTGADGIPVLLVNGEHDPATPLEWAIAVDAALDDSILVSHSAGGHIAMDQSACIADLVTEYLISAVLPPVGTACP